ncbi:DUF455 family protein [Ensifer sp. ENS09]|uniref:DUF455 family protein n=1 Tax=Ensifer sp. ENS09 TaxID=2769263 RepID=UPI001781B28C|nr:DUF455 family protein [Ensifer sp. ENS09]MBD9653133.1 DUF455 family protein [Ensifer sp. ENS09]
MTSFQYDFIDDASFDPADSAASLSDLCRSLVESVQLLAYAIPQTGLIEAKILLARHIERDTEVVTRLNNRIRELGRTIDVQAARVVDQEKAITCFEDESGHLLPSGIYATKAELLASIAKRKAHTHPLWDEPSYRVLAFASEVLSDEIADFNRIKVFAKRVPPSSETIKGAPLRDGRLAVVPDSRMQLKSESADRNLAELMHHTLMGTEIPTIEMTAGLIRDFPDTPWEFVVDISRQLWDEARHAEMCIKRCRQAGFDIGDFPCDHKTWSLTNGKPLELRLAIHQRIGEWLGVDAAIEWTRRLEANSDLRTVGLLNFIVEDEIAHVAIGNKWLRNLCQSEERIWAIHEQAEKVRAEASGPVNGHIPLPLNVDSCLRSGFGEKEIERLAEKREVVVTKVGDL